MRAQWAVSSLGVETRGVISWTLEPHPTLKCLDFSRTAPRKFAKNQLQFVCVVWYVWSNLTFSSCSSGASKSTCLSINFGHSQGPAWYHVSVKLTQDSTMIVAVTFFCYRNHSLKPLLEEYHTRSLPKLASKYVYLQKFPPHNVDPVATSHGSLVMSHLLVLSPSYCCTMMRWKLVRPVSFLGSELVNSWDPRGGFVGNVTLHFTSKRSTVLNTFLVAMYFSLSRGKHPEKGS